MKPVTKALLQFLRPDEMQRQVAEMICDAEDINSPRLWLGINDFLIEATRCCSFGRYKSVAECCVMCVACAPQSSDCWQDTVLLEFSRRADHWRMGGSLSLGAYEMGSLIGLFQAGAWLQENCNAPLAPSFLPAMAEYCIACLGRPCQPVNCNVDHDLDGAMQNLDRAIKNYLRPPNAELTCLLHLELKTTFIRLQKNLGDELLANPSALSGPGRWLLDALVYGVLDLDRRTSIALIPAAVALIP